MTIIKNDIVQYKWIQGGDEWIDFLQHGVGLVKNELYHKTPSGNKFLA
jgi:hypothetical protein